MKRFPRFPDVDWYCDHCGDHLSSQPGFDDHKYVWKCAKCGGKSSISRDNIRRNNYAVLFGAFQVLELLRTICMHCILITIALLLLGTAFDDVQKHMTFPAFAYLILFVITLMVITANYRGIGFFGAIFDLFFGDISRPFRELFRTRSIFRYIRMHTKKSVVLWNGMKLLIYAGIITTEVLLIIQRCTIGWGSVGAALNAGRNWLSNVEGLKELYIPFMIFVGAMNLITFLAFGLDKYYAVKQKWRTKESTLFLFSIFFGAIGAVTGMLIFRHKINKPSFKNLLPLLAIMLALLIAWASKGYFA